MAYVWTDLLDDIKVRGSIPTSQNTYTAARFLNVTNAVMKAQIVPLVLKVREKYYEYDDDRLVSAGPSYVISRRAVGGVLVNAALVNGNNRLDLALYDEEELSDYTAAPATAGLYLKRNRAILVPSDGAGWPTFRMTIGLRPNQIVDPGDAAQITAINTGTKTVTCSTVPTSWATTNTFDILQAEAHYDWWAIDQAVTAVVTGTGGTITFSSALPTDLAVGDWIALAGQSPTVQCPEEFHPLLAQEVANVFLAQRDKDAYAIGEKEAKLLRDGLVPLIANRVQKEGRKITNRTGILRRGL